jgi:hypothetical protein
MGLIVPTELEKVLREADESAGPLVENALWSAQMKAAPDPKVATLDERRGTFAEIAAWRFMRPHGGSESEPWGIYWGPLAGGTLQDGTPFHQPDVAEVDEEILTHWIGRATTAKHPVIKARYADLAWEIGRYLRRPSKDRQNSAKAPITLDIPVTMAQVAIDAYLDAVERGLSEDEYYSWAYLDRAIGLAISLNDKTRAARAKRVLFAFHRKAATRGGRFHWARLNDLTEDRSKALGLDDADHKEIIDSLEVALAHHSDIAYKENFDPHQAMDAADRLTRRLGSNQDEVKRVIKRAAGAFEEAARGADGLLAIAWLEPLIPRYRNAGLVEDAARVEQTIRGRAEQARGEMKRISVPVEIPREKMEQWADAVIGATFQDALGRIAWHCMTREDNAQKSVQQMMEKAPLVSMLTANVMGVDGFTEATIGSVEDDLEGRAIQHAANSFNWNAPFLYFILNRAKEKYGFDLDAMISHIRHAPFFAPGREPLLREGLAAWLAEDPVKAIHVLVPQVEAACRDLLAALGAPVMRHEPRTGGFEVLGMGAVLSHPAFRKGVPQDIRFHLKALYCDPRGINLRNHLAHGIANIGILGMGAANWVVHSILLLAILRLKQRPAEDGKTPGN